MWKLALGVILMFASAQCNPVKFCVYENEMPKCNDMRQAFSTARLSPEIQCVKAQHETGCLRMIASGEADIRSGADRSIFVGGNFSGLIPFMSEKRTSADAESFFYKAVVAVRTNGPIKSLADLKGKKSCHTGVLRTVGWTIPVANLLRMKLMDGVDCENSVKNVNGYFPQSCAPGAFDLYNNPTNDNPPQICALCENNMCPFSGDKYGGYNGAFRGLVDSRCDVAFIKHSTIPSDAKTAGFSYNEADYQLLCPNGNLKGVNEWSDCTWATRPTNALLARPGSPIQTYKDLLSQADSRFGSTAPPTGFQLYNSSKYGGSDLIFDDDTKQLATLSQQTYKTFLGEGFTATYTEYHPTRCEKQFRWCTISDAEQKKCQEFAYALAGQRITNKVTCIKGNNPDDCFTKLRANQADMITVDSGHIYTGGRYFNLKPIISENYQLNVDDPTNYYSVAVVKKSNTGFNLRNLRNKKTCHTGIERTAGWNVPVGYFIKEGQITVDMAQCNHAEAAANYFGNMCVPGALEKTYNPRGTNPRKMCMLCENNCQYSGTYSGYTGAFRCLVELDGDVAFVKHTTVPGLTDGKGTEDWNRNLNSADYELLCQDGTRKPLDQWSSCHIARVPSHAVMASNTLDAAYTSHYQIALQRADVKFGKGDGANTKHFEMFKSPKGFKDLMFKDSTQKLNKVTQKYRDFLGDYFQTAEAMDTKRCTMSAASPVHASWIMAVLAFAVYQFI